jgi:hypothetical protein
VKTKKAIRKDGFSILNQQRCQLAGISGWFKIRKCCTSSIFCFHCPDNLRMKGSDRRSFPSAPQENANPMNLHRVFCFPDTLKSENYSSRFLSSLETALEV